MVRAASPALSTVENATGLDISPLSLSPPLCFFSTVEAERILHQKWLKDGLHLFDVTRLYHLNLQVYLGNNNLYFSKTFLNWNVI